MKMHLVKQACAGHLTLQLNIKRFVEVESGWYYMAILALHPIIIKKTQQREGEMNSWLNYIISASKVPLLKPACVLWTAVLLEEMKYLSMPMHSSPGKLMQVKYQRQC